MLGHHRPTVVTIEGTLAAIELGDPLKLAVPARDRLSAWFLTDILAEMLDDPRHAQQVARLIESLTFTRPPPGRVYAATMQMLESGALQARFVTAAWAREARGWEEQEARPLLPTDGPTVGPGRGPAPYEKLRTTWVSFDVLDDDGEPLPNGRFDVVLDGRVEGGLLDDGIHRYEPLREQATAVLGIQRFFWSYDPGRTGAAPHSPTDHQPGSLTFEVLDRDGDEVDGEYTFVSSPTEHRAPLDGVHEHEAAAGPAALRLHGLSFPTR
ncbi:MAG: hypothetical protein AB1Z98_04485 [Nannocystaceae bacterium]